MKQKILYFSYYYMTNRGGLYKPHHSSLFSLAVQSFQTTIKLLYLFPFLQFIYIMGIICSSYESTSVATAKLILHDGRLQEFSYPIKASFLLQNDPTIFICNSDEMDFGNVVCAVKAEEELQLGQLYFALPLSQLKHKLKAEEMAALAVKASSALNHSSSSGEKFIVFEKSGPNFSKKMVDVNNDPTPKGNGRRKKFTAKLSSINE